MSLIPPTLRSRGLGLGLSLALALGLLACDGKSALTTTVTVPRADIQTTVKTKFPISKTQNNVKVTLSNPQVRLDGAKERLIMETDLLVVLPAVKIGRKGVSITPPALTGKAIVDGDITFDKGAGTVYFSKGELRELKLDQLPAEYNAKVKTTAEAQVKAQLDHMPIFTLDGAKLEQAAAKQLLQSIKVKDEGLELTVGM